MRGEIRERKRQLREAEAEQLKCKRRNAALPQEFAELRKQAGLAEGAFSTPSISVALEPHSRQRNHTREVIFGVPDIEIRRQFIAFERQADKENLEERWAEQRVRHMRREIIELSQFPVYSVLAGKAIQLSQTTQRGSSGLARPGRRRCARFEKQSKNQLVRDALL
jgi:hypothetical protein